MGSYASTSTKSTASDNRMAGTDQAVLFGQKAKSNVAYAAPIFNLNAGASATAKSGKGGSFGGSSGSAKGGKAIGGEINLSVLDGGAIANSFEFADNALSKMLSSVLETERLQSDSAQYTADTIGQALADVASQNKAAQDSALTWVEENFKNLMGMAAIGFVGWYFIKKAK